MIHVNQGREGGGEGAAYLEYVESVYWEADRKGDTDMDLWL